MTEQEIRADERERCFREICPYCGMATPNKIYRENGFWLHAIEGEEFHRMCDAKVIRERAYQEELAAAKAEKGS